MECPEFENWLNEAPVPTFPRLPARLEEHIKGCSHCQARLAFVLETRKKLAGLEPGPAEFAAMSDAVMARAFPASKPVGAKNPETSAAPESGFLVSWLSPRLAAAFALWFITLFFTIFAIFFMKNGRSPSIPDGALFAFAESDSVTLSDATGASIAAGKPETRIGFPSSARLTDAASVLKLRYPGRFSVSLRGNGECLIRESGFDISNGKVTASFTILTEPMRIKVPLAVIGVRGTLIVFALDHGRGDVSLLEGNAEVFPDCATMANFILKPGQTLGIDPATGLKVKELPPANETEGKAASNGTNTAFAGAASVTNEVPSTPDAPDSPTPVTPQVTFAASQPENPVSKGPVESASPAPLVQPPGTSSEPMRWPVLEDEPDGEGK